MLNIAAKLKPAKETTSDKGPIHKGNARVEGSRIICEWDLSTVTETRETKNGAPYVVCNVAETSLPKVTIIGTDAEGNEVRQSFHVRLTGNVNVFFSL